ncbi:hypothetical protein B0H16DRAFT_1555606 [Mycena metata]|uniref:Uncharacterized protein n=1 Tax=Mycena metata TaxID=1033252 RepID=A0AAD7IPC9_9AGAR|nr:hypothetical protein B0H16DRAFT_1555606 [Mycena metata]
MFVVVFLLPSFLFVVCFVFLLAVFIDGGRLQMRQDTGTMTTRRVVFEYGNQSPALQTNTIPMPFCYPSTKESIARVS